MPSFSPYWITIPLGLGMFAWMIWEVRHSGSLKTRPLYSRFLSVLRGNDELQKLKEELRFRSTQVSTLESERDRYKTEAEGKAEELARLGEEFKAFKQQHGRWRIHVCGMSDTPLGLSVSVKFIEPRDAGLAERVLGYFITARPIWKTKDIEPIKWFRNPSKARIVIFSDHDNAEGIKAAFNDCDLLEEPVDRFDVGFARGNIPDVDIAIVVFPSTHGQR